MRSIAIAGIFVATAVSDFDAMTLTIINPAARTYRVTPMGQAARAQMEAMKKSGGPGAEAMEKVLAAIPASDFDVPAGFKKAER